jgi:hypothetical protein
MVVLYDIIVYCCTWYGIAHTKSYCSILQVLVPGKLCSEYVCIVFILVCMIALKYDRDGSKTAVQDRYSKKGCQPT